MDPPQGMVDGHQSSCQGEVSGDLWVSPLQSQGKYTMSKFICYPNEDIRSHRPPLKACRDGSRDGRPLHGTQV